MRTHYVMRAGRNQWIALEREWNPRANSQHMFTERWFNKTREGYKNKKILETKKSKTILEGKILEVFNLNGFRGECRRVKGGDRRKAKTQTPCFWCITITRGSAKKCENTRTESEETTECSPCVEMQKSRPHTQMYNKGKRYQQRNEPHVCGARIRGGTAFYSLYARILWDNHLSHTGETARL
jgi:hypothetical protein